MNPPDESPSRKQFAAGWYLAAPWMIAIIVVVIALTGVGPRAASNLPFGLGQIALNNAGWGLILFTIICSALWARRRGKAKGMRSESLIPYIIMITFLLTIAQAVAMAGVFFVGCLFTFSGSL